MNYNVVANTPGEKEKILKAIKTSGARLDAVSGYYSGYYVQLAATAEQANKINKILKGI